jgi:hypothetical protein
MIASASVVPTRGRRGPRETLRRGSGFAVGDGDELRVRGVAKARPALLLGHLRRNRSIPIESFRMPAGAPPPATSRGVQAGLNVCSTTALPLTILMKETLAVYIALAS